VMLAAFDQEFLDRINKIYRVFLGWLIHYSTFTIQAQRPVALLLFSRRLECHREGSGGDDCDPEN